MLHVCCCRLLLKCQSTTVVSGGCYYVTCLLLQVVTEVSEHDGCVGTRRHQVHSQSDHQAE